MYWLGVGAGATVLMDLWSLLLRRMGIPTLDYAMLGRWCGHWTQGRWFHQSIKDAAAVRGEKVCGWALHYFTGIAFAFALACWVGPHWIKAPTLTPALLMGILSVALPWLILQPALGAGVAAAKTPRPWMARAASLTTHVVFGCGLFLSARAMA
ncbi:DUF2938 family protein [Allopusillimonas ginsengisoli]|nr:DUF2938 family protein [Allopusillimonas ginsengisoli]